MEQRTIVNIAFDLIRVRRDGLPNLGYPLRPIGPFKLAPRYLSNKSSRTQPRILIAFSCHRSIKPLPPCSLIGLII